MSTIFEQLDAVGYSSIERANLTNAVDSEVATSGSPTPERMREALRVEMEDCPACVPEDAYEIPDGDLVKWLLSHGVDPRELKEAPGE